MKQMEETCKILMWEDLFHVKCQDKNRKVNVHVFRVILLWWEVLMTAITYVPSEQQGKNY